METRTVPLIDSPHRQTPASGTPSPEAAILTLITASSPVNFDDLMRLVPQLTWNQIFHTVDALSRQGRIALYRRKHGYDVMGIPAMAQRQ